MVANKPRGIRNNNPGNLRLSKDPWQGLAEKQTDKAFFVFKEPTFGIRALARTLIVYYDKHKLNTVKKIISRWAPPNENDTGAYVNAVADAIGVKPNDIVDLHDFDTLYPLVAAIIKHENGQQPYTRAQLTKGLVLAGIEPKKKETVAKTPVVKGQQVAALGTVGSVATETIAQNPDAITAISAQLQPLVDISDVLKWVFVALTLIGIGYTVYAQWDNRRKGIV